MAGKEATIFIVDSNYSMNAPYPCGSQEESYKCSSAVVTSNISSNLSAPHISNEPNVQSTRLSCAKEAILNKIIQTAWKSKVHEFGLVVLKTRNTHHHLLMSDEIDDIDERMLFQGNSLKCKRNDDLSPPFPNLIEISLTKPTHYLLRTVQSIQSTSSPHSDVQGDFCDGIILAADSLYRRTSGRKYKRRIILITDAEHEVKVNEEQLECVLNGLKKLECSLEVLGIGFENKGEFRVKQEEKENENDTHVDLDNSMNLGNTLSTVKKEQKSDIELQEERLMLIKRDNEKLLLSLAQLSGGCVSAVNGENLTTILDLHEKNEIRVTKVMRSNCKFRITPTLSVDAKWSKIINQTALPSLKKDAYILNESTGQPLRDGGGEIMTCPIDSIVFHTLAYDPENSDDRVIEVPLEDRTNAYRYGSDLIPISQMDMAGINAAFKSPKSVEIIGYISSKEVKDTGLCMGPAYAIYGGKDCVKAVVAIGALAQAINEKDVWILCRFVKSNDGEPRIGILLPRIIRSNNKGDLTRGYLVLLQLPFADDVNYMKPPEVPSHYWGDKWEVSACDDLVDALMLQDDQLDSTSISFPALQSYQRLIAHIAMKPTKEQEIEKTMSIESIFEASHISPLSHLELVKSLSEKASNEIYSFIETFPCMKNNTGKKQKKKYWGEAMEI